jgi:hypothetical protein
MGMGFERIDPDRMRLGERGQSQQGKNRQNRSFVHNQNSFSCKHVLTSFHLKIIRA